MIRLRRNGGLVAALCVLVLSMVPGSAQGQDVRARARLDSSTFLVGDPIAIHVDLRHLPGITMQPLVADTAGPFSILSRSPLERTSDTTSAITFIAAKYDSGDAQIPPLPFVYSLANDTTQHVAVTNPLMVTVLTVPLDTTGEIRDVRPPFSIPLSLSEILLYLGIASAVTAVGYFLYRYWRRRKAVAAGEVYTPPPRPAHVVALEELAELKEKKLWQQGLIKQYYSEVTEILRRYFENRYRQPALEETTDEILRGLRRVEYPTDLLGTTENILQRADLVKFAKHQPSLPEHEETLTVVYEIVDRTKSIGMTPAEEIPVQESSDVAR